MANEKKEEKTSEGKGGSDMEIVVSGPANETKGNALARKYKEMANMRRDYEDIDIRDCIPTLEEMVKDDLMYEILEDAANGKTEDDVVSTAFYTEEPPKFDVGYDEARNVFIFKASRVNFTDAEIDLNQIDGDTMRIPLSSVIGAEKPFTMNNGLSYDSFRDYCNKNGLECYIILAANNFEFCENQDCVDVSTGKHIQFEDYYKFREFYLGRREKNENKK